MSKTEGHQLRAFANFVRKLGYVQYLKKKEWANFAYQYNGEDFGDLLESACKTLSQKKK
jgi:hypothetical protein